MHTMGEERDMFAGLGWENDIRSLGDLHVPFNLLLEYDIGAGNQNSDDYDLTSFSQFIQAWRWRMYEHKQYVKKWEEASECVGEWHHKMHE